VTLEGWIFMVGLRVFDVGALIVWLVWFFRLRDDDDDGEDFRRGDGGSDGPDPDPSPGGGGLQLPLPDADPWPGRMRDHGAERMPRRGTVRRGAPEPTPARAPMKRRGG
jgi:hypothetical protein